MNHDAAVSSPARVLVVDDDFFTTKLLSYQLKQLGVERIDVCNSVSEALQFIHTTRCGYDLVFTDLRMPTADGVEFLRALADADYRGNIIVFSGEGDDLLAAAQRLAQGFGLTVVGALSKPVSLDELAQSFRAGDSLVDGVQSAQHCEYFGEDELRQALVNREFIVYYQPQVQLRQQRVCGVEALVRWRRASGELVAPADFIPQMEERGLISELTMQVLEQSFAAMGGWLGLDEGLSGEELMLSVNLSAASLDELELPDRIESLANRMSFPLDKLSLEVTESQLVSNSQYALDVLTRLRLKGVGLSIDDFGTGYSSLIQLDQLPFTELKVDRCFVNTASENRVGRAIVKSCVELSRQLELMTVAEGVETPSDFQYVRSVGCDVAQGYGIALPLPESEFLSWQRQWPEQYAALIRPDKGLESCLAG